MNKTNIGLISFNNKFGQSLRDARQHRCCHLGNWCTTCNKK